MSNRYAMASTFLLAGFLLIVDSAAFWRVAPVGGPPPPRGQSSQSKPAGETGGRTRPGPDTALIIVTYPTGTRILVELADTPQKRQRGLMFRDHLAADKGMLFVFEEAAMWSIWMKDTKVPLDILWLGPDKRIIHIEANVPGCVEEPCPLYQSNKDALYVLEVPAGAVKREKLAKGMKLDFDLPKR